MEPASITEKLKASLAGDAQAREELWPAIYDDLRAAARRLMAHERAGHSLQPTALVNEAYLRLIDVDVLKVDGRSHFLGIAARAMRQVLVEHARKHNAAKRGGGAKAITLHSTAAIRWDDPTDVLALDEALQALSEVQPRQAAVVELRLFGGLGLKETAEELSVSRDTVKLDWRFARAWLNGKLQEI